MMGSVFVHVSQVTAPLVPGRTIQDGSRLLLVRLLPAATGTNVELRGTDILRTKTVWSFEYSERENHALEFILSEQISLYKREEIGRLRVPFAWLTPNGVVRESFHMKAIGGAQGLKIVLHVEIHLNENESEPFEAPLAVIKPREERSPAFNEEFESQEFSPVETKFVEVPRQPSSSSSSEAEMEPEFDIPAIPVGAPVVPELQQNEVEVPKEEVEEQNAVPEEAVLDKVSSSSSSDEEEEVALAPSAYHFEQVGSSGEIHTVPPTDDVPVLPPVETAMPPPPVEAPVVQEDEDREDAFMLETTTGERIPWMFLSGDGSQRVPLQQPEPMKMPDAEAYPTVSDIPPVVEEPPPPPVQEIPSQKVTDSFSFYPTREQMMTNYIPPCPLEIVIAPPDSPVQ